MLASGATETQSIADIYVEALKNLGIFPTVTVVDSAQYKERTNNYEFGMAWYTRALSLSPGNEQFLYWGSKGVTDPGSRNWMGMNSPAAEAMIKAMVESRSQEDFIAATRALDRVLTAGRYVIPVWFSKVSRIAHSSQLHYPDRIPLYGTGRAFSPKSGGMRNDRMKKLALIAILTALAGCNTVAGVGDDISGGARTVKSWF